MQSLKLYEQLKLPPCPPMTDEGFMEAVQRAADALKAAQPWLLTRYHDDKGWQVARSRTLVMMLVTSVVNVGRRVRRWWRGRVQLAYEARQAGGNRNG